MPHLGLQPSFFNGYALSSGDAMHEELYSSLVIASVPALGYQGSRLFDFGPNDVGLTSSGNPVWSARHITLGGGPDFLFTDNFIFNPDKVSVFCRCSGFDAISAYPYVLSKGLSGVKMDFGLGGNQNVSRMRWYAANSSGGAIYDLSEVLDLGVMTSWLGTYDRSISVLYKNGKSVASAPKTVAIANSGNRLEIGRLIVPQRYWEGDLEVSYIFNRALSPDEAVLLQINPLAPLLKIPAITSRFVLSGQGGPTITLPQIERHYPRALSRGLCRGLA